MLHLVQCLYTVQNVHPQSVYEGWSENKCTVHILGSSSVIRSFHISLYCYSSTHIVLATIETYVSYHGSSFSVLLFPGHMSLCPVLSVIMSQMSAFHNLETCSCKDFVAVLDADDNHLVRNSWHNHSIGSLVTKFFASCTYFVTDPNMMLVWIMYVSTYTLLVVFRIP